MFLACAEAESIPVKTLVEHDLTEITPWRNGAASETYRLHTLMRLPPAIVQLWPKTTMSTGS